MKFLLRYSLFWLGSFTVFRILFLMINAGQAFAMPFPRWLGVFFNGARMDLATVSYLLFIPLLLLVLYNIAPKFPAKFLIGAYTFALLMFVTVSSSMDPLSYSHWGFRLDLTPLMYMEHPGETFSYVAYWQLGIGLAAWFLMVGGFWSVYQKYVVKSFPTHVPEGGTPVSRFMPQLVLLLLLFVPIIGAFQQAPLNHKNVYFSDDMFANHATINVLWNMGYSKFYQRHVRDRYHYLSDESANKIVDSLYHLNRDIQQPAPRLLRTLDKPLNVIFIMMEGFTANLVGCLGGENLTPNLDALSKEGILFTNFYANGDRTEKGVVAVLAGYPNVPVASMAAYPAKSQKLPGIPRTFVEMGYNTTYYYGGDADFAKIGSFIKGQGVPEIIDKYYFDKINPTDKYCTHDHVIYAKVQDDLKNPQGPFFKIIMSMSSHEPFDVPMETVVPGNDEANMFRNSFVYADRSLGDFIRHCQKMPWWDNTLVVIVADHGHQLPNNLDNFDPTKFRIPMVWLGGALAVRDTVVSTMASQTDIAASLFDQMGIQTGDKYPFSRPFMKPGAPNFAFYTFNDGFGFLTPQGKVAFDNPSHHMLHTEGDSTGLVRLGQAYLQVLANDFVKR